MKDVVIDDKDKKNELPIHVILGASDYSRVKTATKPKIGQPMGRIVELTKLGLTVRSNNIVKTLQKDPVLLEQFDHIIQE